MEHTYDENILRISGDTYKENVYLLGMHLRDATNILEFIQSNQNIDKSDLLAKAVILFASAGLEGNLSYFSTLALAISEAASEPVFKDPEVEYLKAAQLEFSRNAELVSKKQKQVLRERLIIVPKLLGRAVQREFQMPSEEHTLVRLTNALERRDAIVHPRWKAYPEIGVAEAVDAVLGVLEYIDSIRKQFFPYMIGFISMLSRYGHLLAGDVLEPPPLRFRVLKEVRDLTGALAGSWFDAQIMYDAALVHPHEGDSEGSMLTRAALAILYSTAIGQLSIFARLAELTSTAFVERDVNFFNEQEYELDSSGNTVLCDVKQRFEDRATIIPALISKKTCPNTLIFSRGETWFQNMFKKYFDMRNAVMHSSFGEVTPRVSKAELKEAVDAVRKYFAFLATAGGQLGIYNNFIESSTSRDTH